MLLYLVLPEQSSLGFLSTEQTEPNEVSADISMSLGTDVVNYAWKMCQPTEEGALLRSGGMQALGVSNVQDNL